MERLRDFLIQQNAHVAAGYFAALDSHDPIFIDAIETMAIISDKLCHVIADKLEAHNDLHEPQEWLSQSLSA